VPTAKDSVGRRWEPGDTLTEGQVTAGDLKQLIAAGALGKPKVPAVTEPEDEEDEDG
jgi:hypothetical protein